MYRLAIIVIFLFQTCNAQEIETIPFFGFNKISKGFTSLQEIKKQYPEATIRKARAKRVFPELFGWNYKVVEVADMGISFTLRRNRRLGKFLVDVIKMNMNFPLKTEDGIGIGSNYLEIKRGFGPQIIVVVNSHRTEISYFKYKCERIKGMTCLTFGCNNPNADTSNFIVDYMVIW